MAFLTPGFTLDSLFQKLLGQCGFVCVALLGLWGLSPVWASVPQANTKIVINIPEARLRLYTGGLLLKTYPVGLGQSRFPTPIGHFKVIRKTVNPGWENPYLKQGQMQILPGETNPLGLRWIGFNPGPAGEYGMHGTDTPSSVGQFKSHGCVRMHNKDVMDLFERVTLGTPVHVTYEPFVIWEEKQHLYIRSLPNIYNRKHSWVPAALQRIGGRLSKPNPAQLTQRLKGLESKPGTKIDLGLVANPPKPTSTLPQPPVPLSQWAGQIVVPTGVPK